MPCTAESVLLIGSVVAAVVVVEPGAEPSEATFSKGGDLDSSPTKSIPSSPN